MSASHRRRVRILAMQALCQWDAQQDTDPDALAVFLADFEAESEQTGTAKPAAVLVQTFWDQAESIDVLIQQAARDWSIERMGAVDRNAMRVAVVEMKLSKAPVRVIINEALEIVREYGGRDSVRFVNGVLDAVARSMEEL